MASKTSKIVIHADTRDDNTIDYDDALTVDAVCSASAAAAAATKIANHSQQSKNSIDDCEDSDCGNAYASVSIETIVQSPKLLSSTTNSSTISPDRVRTSIVRGTASSQTVSKLYDRYNRFVVSAPILQSSTASFNNRSDIVRVIPDTFVNRSTVDETDRFIFRSPDRRIDDGVGSSSGGGGVGGRGGRGSRRFRGAGNGHDHFRTRCRSIFQCLSSVFGKICSTFHGNVTAAMIDLDQTLMANNRLLRYTMFVTFAFFTFLDVLKVDAYYSALLYTMIDNASHNSTNTKQISSILVANEVMIAFIQMLVVGILEQYFLPSIWSFVNFLITILTWMTFDSPHVSPSRFLLIFFLRALNVRYSVIVYWLGKRYDSYTMVVQFFISLLPSIMKLPLFHFYRQIIIFGLQFELLLAAIAAFVIFVSAYSLYVTRLTASQVMSEQLLQLRQLSSSSSPQPPPPESLTLQQISFCTETDRNNSNRTMTRAIYDKSGSWLCNLACVLFLSGVYYDFPVFTTFAVVYLNYDITYDIIYVHIGLFVTVFFMNISYNIFRVLHRRYLCRLYGHNNNVEIEIHRNEKRYLFAMISYVCVILSRVCFLMLQLFEYPSATILTVCICFAGLGGNVQPLLAELMFRQRNQPQCTSSRYNRSRAAYHRSAGITDEPNCNDDLRTRVARWLERHWRTYSNQAFKWFYIDGKSIVNLLLLAVWMSLYNYIGPWWFSANSILLLLVSMTLFVVYYRRYILIR